jgi:hypothetical protein
VSATPVLMKGVTRLSAVVIMREEDVGGMVPFGDEIGHGKSTLFWMLLIRSSTGLSNISVSNEQSLSRAA